MSTRRQREGRRLKFNQIEPTNLPLILEGTRPISSEEKRKRTSRALRGKSSLINRERHSALGEEIVKAQLKQKPEEKKGGFSVSKVLKGSGTVLGTAGALFGGLALGSTALGQPEVAVPAEAASGFFGGVGALLGIAGEAVQELTPKDKPFQPNTPSEIESITKNTDRFLMDLEQKKNKILREDQQNYINNPNTPIPGLSQEMIDDINSFTTNQALRDKLISASRSKLSQDVTIMRRDTQTARNAGFDPPPVGTRGGIAITSGNVTTEKQAEPGLSGDPLATQPAGNAFQPKTYYEDPKGTNPVIDDEAARERQEDFRGLITTFSNQTQRMLDQEENPYIKEMLISNNGNWNEIEDLQPFRKEMWDTALGKMYGDIEEATRTRILKTFMPGLYSTYATDGVNFEFPLDNDISVKELAILGNGDLGRLGTVPEIGQPTSMDNAMTVGSSNMRSSIDGSTLGMGESSAILTRMEDSLQFFDNSTTNIKDKDTDKPLLYLDKPANWDDGSDDPRLKVVRPVYRPLRSEKKRPVRPKWGQGIFEQPDYNNPQTLPAALADIRGDPFGTNINRAPIRHDQVQKVRNSKATQIRSVQELLPVA